MPSRNKWLFTALVHFHTEHQCMEQDNNLALNSGVSLKCDGVAGYFQE